MKRKKPLSRERCGTPCNSAKGASRLEPNAVETGSMTQRRPPSHVGVVAIGRNEGQRLKKCLESVVGIAGQVVYVDSGSTDGSVGMARAMGVAVVELDTRISFRAGRARNEGFQRCRELMPELEYVQFVDGDCEVVAGWIEKGSAYL